MRGTVPEALRKHLLPRRSVAGTAHPKSGAQVMKWVAATYPKLREHYGVRTNARIFEAGLESKKNQDLLVPRRAAHALLLRFDAAGIAAADLATLAVAERVAAHLDREGSLTPAIAMVRGLSVAIEVAFLAAEFETDHDGGYPNAVLIVPTQGEPQWNRMPVGMVRHLVCAASDEAYASARDHAAALRAEGPTRGRRTLAFAFPDEAWADEEILRFLDGPQDRGREAPGYLLSAASNAAYVQRWAEERQPHPIAHHALDLVAGMDGAGAIPLFQSLIPKLLVRPSYGPVLKTPPRQLAQAIGCYGTMEAALALAPYAAHPILGPQILAWFRDHPQHGDALKKEASTKKLATTAARVLAAPEKAPALATSLPPLLVERPWRKKRADVGSVVKDLPLHGLELERVALVGKPERLSARFTVRDMTPEELEGWKKSAEKDENISADLASGGLYTYLRVPDEEGLWAWANKKGYLRLGPLAWVEKHGLRTIDGFTSEKRDWVGGLGWDGQEPYFDAARSLISPRIAPAIAAVAARRKDYRRAANAWLLEHVEVATLGLVHAWVSPNAEARGHAERALIWLAQRGQGEVIVAAARRYSAEVEAAVTALLQRDPLALGASAPKPPSFLSMGQLPPVLVKAGGALDDATRAALSEILQLTPLDDPYPGLSAIRETCDADSLAAFCLELLEQWVLGDAPGRHEWMLFACVHFRSEKGTRRIAELAREWARKNQAKAARACVALAAEGSDLALLHLAHIADTTRFAVLKETAEGLLHETARARGLSADALGDRTVPDLGLSREGLVLSLGARSFEVHVDGALKLTVRERREDGLGEAKAGLPRAQKDEDAETQTARERFAQLKKDLETTGQRQLRRLERAMVQGRTWDVPTFEALFVAHPLLTPMVRGLVWEVLGGAAFRACDDGTYADVSDATITLSASDEVRIAHPARSDLTAWSTVFGDYALVQPFEQLGRTVHRLSGDATALHEAAGKKVPARKLLGTLESRGWERDDRSNVTALIREVRGREGTLLARWSIDPAIAIDEYFAQAPDVTTQALTVLLDEVAQPLSTLDPVAYSELRRDIDAVHAL